MVRQLNASQWVKVSGPPAIETVESYVMFRKNITPALIEDFDRTYAAMRKGGSFKSIEDRYAQYAATP